MITCNLFDVNIKLAHPTVRPSPFQTPPPPPRQTLSGDGGIGANKEMLFGFFISKILHNVLYNILVLYYIVLPG